MEDHKAIIRFLKNLQDESFADLIEKMTQTLTDQELVKGGNLRSPEKVKQENQQKVEMELHGVCEKIKNDVEEAMQLIREEVPHFLTKSELQDFTDNMSGIADKMKACGREEIMSQIESMTSLADFFGLTEKTIRDIYRVGYRRYEGKDFESAGKVFFLLTLLNPFISDYWLAYGLANHQLKLYEMASVCYTHSIFLEPVKPLARWYATEAYLAQEKWDEAFLEWEVLEKLIQEQGLDENWQKIASYLQEKIDDRKII